MNASNKIQDALTSNYKNTKSFRGGRGARRRRRRSVNTRFPPPIITRQRHHSNVSQLPQSMVPVFYPPVPRGSTEACLMLRGWSGTATTPRHSLDVPPLSGAGEGQKINKSNKRRETDIHLDGDEWTRWSSCGVGPQKKRALSPQNVLSP